MAPKKLTDIPCSCFLGLSRILDASHNPNENWKALAEVIGLYDVVDIANFERKSLQINGSPSESLLRDWAMTGSNVDELFTLLYKIHNSKAFSFLKESGYVSKSLTRSLILKQKSLSKHNGISQGANVNHNHSLNSHDARSLMNFIVPKESTKDLSLSVVNERKDSLTDDILHSLRNKGLIEFSYNEVCSATHNFDDSKLKNGGCKLGMGSFGTVYKGELKNTTFAIKKLNLQENMQARSVGLSQFAVEVLTLSKYRHPNLLELAGYSLDPKAPCLIYYYMEKGSLASVLASKESSNIPWQSRLKISEDISKGLVYLHTALDKPLIHRDLKSANVLLTNDYQAKIGDFGLACLGSNHNNSIVVTNRLQGTMGYIAPEAASGNISTKTDTYSYGVLMLELLTNLQAFDPNRGYENQSLVGFIENSISHDFDISKIIAPEGVKWPLTVAEQFLDISRICFEIHSLRPTTNVILEKITKLIDINVSQERDVTFDRWLEPDNIVLKPPKPLCTNRKTILVLTNNKHQSNLIQRLISKLLDGNSKTSSLRNLQDMDFYFVTLYDAIVIVSNPITNFLKCLHDSINRFNPDLVISTGLCHGIRGKVSLGDLIVCKEIPATGNMVYQISDKVQGVMSLVQRCVMSNTALWQLPGLLPKSPNHTASQILLWLSKLIVEVNLENCTESTWLKKVGYDHNITFIENMKILNEKLPCLRNANMRLLIDQEKGVFVPDINLKVGVQTFNDNITLQRKKFKPTLHFGAMFPNNIPYQEGLAFERHRLCPENMIGCDPETLQLYSTCSKTHTPCVSIKSVYSFSDPYEDSRYDEMAFHMSMLGVTQFLSSYLSSNL